MKMAYKIALGSVLVVGIAGVAVAANGPRFGGEHPGTKMFAQADTNSDSAISMEEMTAALTARFKEADADGDSMVTKAEVIAAVEKRSEGRAARFSGRISDQIVIRTDINDDGKIALSEIENRSKKLFALMDFNDDGKVEKAEIGRSMPQGRGRHHGGGWGRHGMGQDDSNKAE